MRIGIGIAMLLLTAPLAAQTPDAGTSRWESAVRLHGVLFENFFQAPEEAPQEDVTAWIGELRTAYRLATRRPLAVYGGANYTSFSDGLDSSTGARIGLRSIARPAAFDVYLDHQRDRPTFDVGDVFDRADITTLNAEYAYRVTRHWQVGVNGELQQQSFDITESKDNQFAGAGGAVRYRGFGSRFSPEVGVFTGERDVDDETESYEQTDYYLQLRSVPVRPLYLSVRYRHRTRDYQTTSVLSSNFGREDERDQIAVVADYRTGPSLVWNLYYATEDVDSTLPSRTFDTSLVILGVTFEF